MKKLVNSLDLIRVKSTKAQLQINSFTSPTQCSEPNASTFLKVGNSIGKHLQTFFLCANFFSLRYRLWIFSRKRWFLHAFQLSTSERLWCSWAGSFGGWKDCRSEFRNKNISSRIMMIGRRLKCLRGQKLTTLRQQKKEANCWVIMKTRPLNRFSCSASTPCGCLMTKAFFITTSTERKKILVSWEIKKYCLMTWLSDVRSKWPGSRRLVSLRLPRNSLGMKSRNRNE